MPTFFTQRTISRWNKFSQEAIDAPSVNSFKNHLDKKGRMDFFLHCPMAASARRRR